MYALQIVYKGLALFKIIVSSKLFVPFKPTQKFKKYKVYFLVMFDLIQNQSHTWLSYEFRCLLVISLSIYNKQKEFK